jgi:hypothetical protein
VFYITARTHDLPSNLRPFVPDYTDLKGFIRVTIIGDQDEALEVGWKPFQGRFFFQPYTITRSKEFDVFVSIIPTDQVDPNDSSSDPLIRRQGTNAKLSGKPDNIILVSLLPTYTSLSVPSSSTFEAELAARRIRPEDVFHKSDPQPVTDGSNNVIANRFDVLSWYDTIEVEDLKQI